MTSMEFEFVKMHGAGNDYVYVDCFNQPSPLDPCRLARVISDRHCGVGSDGLVLMQKSQSASVFMRMFNADGSESEMCGNGVRCVAHLAVANGHAKAPLVSVETGRGVLSLVVTQTGPRTSQVRVDMGEPILKPSNVPVLVIEENQEKPIVDGLCSPLGEAQGWWKTSGLDPRMTIVSMGNPHVVLYCRDTTLVPLETIGPAIENHSIFPKRINVHFVQVLLPDRVRMRTWERGSGITQACGTGASAVCVAGVLSGRSHRKIVAEVPGGNLELDWDESSGTVFMTGPAEEVFRGRWPVKAC